ncbi:anti-repressor SinI family protein [Metabacillus sp. Hm71]
MNGNGEPITIDPEWEELILSALNEGISLEEIRRFLGNYHNVGLKIKS